MSTAGVTDTVRALWTSGMIAERFQTPLEALEGLSEAEAADLLRIYQGRLGVDPSGSVDPATRRALKAPRYCSHPDVMCLQDGGPHAWPELDLRWTVLGPGTFTGLTADEVLACFTWAWDQWAQVCAIRPAYTGRAIDAHVLIECREIDRPGGVLAYSEVADRSMRAKRQTFDRFERWCYQIGPGVPAFRMDLGRVACHEIGHVLGIPHLASGCLMQPMYDPRIWKPLAPDIAEAQRRYGPPSKAAPVQHLEAPCDHKDEEHWTLTITGTGPIPTVTTTRAA